MLGDGFLFLSMSKVLNHVFQYNLLDVLKFSLALIFQLGVILRMMHFGALLIL